MSLPETWVQTTVRAVVEDIQPGFAQKPGEKDEGTTSQIRTHNVTPDGKISLEGIKHITASEKELARYSLTVGDVVFNNTNSEEWVGKTAVFDREGGYVFSNHMTRLRAHRDLVCPEYLAGYLHLLWSMGYAKTRAKRWVSQAGIESNTLASFKIPLPTLPEQQHIVDLLRQAETFHHSRISTQETLDTVIREQYMTLFGDVLRNDKKWPVRKISQISELVRGSSPRPQGDPRLFGGPVPRLMVSDLTRDGLWVNATTDSLTEEGAKSSRPMPAQSVVMAVSGAPGLTAILNHDACIHDGFVGLRDLNTDLLPEFVAFTLNLLRVKNDQQAVGAVFRNLTTDQVKSMVIPVPPIEKQRTFRQFLLQWQAIQRDIKKSRHLLGELMSALTINAYSGELTAVWREKSVSQIAEAALVRNQLLSERGTKVSPTSAVKTSSTSQAVPTTRPARHWLRGELSEFQRELLAAVTKYCGQNGQPLLVEVPEEFARFCDDEAVKERLQAFGESLGNRIRRSLSQLAALGLIAKITLPKQDPETGERDYLKAFRLLRLDEFTRMADVQALRKASSNDDNQHHYSFLVQLDYETSERAGASGMFQVISVEDEGGKDFTHLVDQGRHYASLTELQEAIASTLKVEKRRIELEEV